MKKMVCSLLAFLLLAGCAPAVDPDLTPESIMKNALRKSEEEVQEALGVSFEGAERQGRSPTTICWSAASPLGTRWRTKLNSSFTKGSWLVCGTPSPLWKPPKRHGIFWLGWRGSRGSKGCVPPWRIPMDKGLPMTAMIPLRTSRL